MKKQDLQNFDIVETRTGNLYMVNADKGVLFGAHGWASLEGYEDDLTGKGLYEEARDHDIVRVRRPEKEYQHARCQWTEAPIIWQRKEKPKLSHEEEVILRALNKPEWWIARDCFGLYLYEEKPVLTTSGIGWEGGGGRG